MACTCTTCTECNGSGFVWFAFPGPYRGGAYLGSSRRDDLDEMESCMYCEGRGVTEMCDDCAEDFEDN